MKLWSIGNPWVIHRFATSSVLLCERSVCGVPTRLIDAKECTRRDGKLQLQMRFSLLWQVACQLFLFLILSLFYPSLHINRKRSTGCKSKSLEIVLMSSTWLLSTFWSSTLYSIYTLHCLDEEQLLRALRLRECPFSNLGHHSVQKHSNNKYCFSLSAALFALPLAVPGSPTFSPNTETEMGFDPDRFPSPAASSGHQPAPYRICQHPRLRVPPNDAVPVKKWN